MATLTAWKFETPSGAGEASKKLQALARKGTVAVDDAATVSWDLAAEKPKTRQLATTAAGALGGAFWGLLFGLIFFVPLLGAAMGAATGAEAGSLTDVGIDDTFINKVRDQVTPGTSALFVLSSSEAMHTLEAAFAGHRPAELIFANLSAQQEEALRRVFTE